MVGALHMWLFFCAVGNCQVLSEEMHTIKVKNGICLIAFM